MTSKQRLLAAANHQVTDRVAITFDAEAEVYAALHEYLGVGSREELFDRLNCDTWMIRPGNFIYPDSERAKKVKTSIWGFRSTVTPYSGGTYDEVTFRPLAGKDRISDIDAHSWPGNDALDFGHFAAEAHDHRDRAIIGVFTWGAYFVASFVRGMEDLMTDFAVNRRYLDHLINTIAERMLFFLDRMLAEAGEAVDVVYMADDYCSQRAPLFSPADFKTFVLPYLSKVADRVHKKGKKFLLHVCGAVRPLMGMIIDAGVDMLEPIQVRAAGMEPAGLKRDFGRDICFYGGVDLQELLCKATPRQVSEEVKRLIGVLGEGGGYVFGPGHTYIQIDAPMENILAMYDTAAAYRPWSD